MGTKAAPGGEPKQPRDSGAPRAGAASGRPTGGENPPANRARGVFFARPEVALAAIIVGYIAVRLWQFHLWPHSAEDAYITFRAARNWVEWGAPTFNRGEPSWPASSPLWLMWCALGYLAHVPLDLWSKLGSLVAECFLVAWVSKHLGRMGALAFSAILLGTQMFIALSLSGIEMYVMCAALAWALDGSGVALAVLAASRPEGLALAVAIGFLERGIEWLVPGFIPWLIVGILCHQWAPAGVTAKVGTYGLHLFQGTYWLAALWPFQPKPDPQAIGLLGLVGLVCLWFVRSRFVWVGMGLLVAYWIAGSVYFCWYMTLPLLALAYCVAWLASKNRLGIAAAILVALSSWVMGGPHLKAFVVRYQVEKRWEVQYRGFQSVSGFLPDSGTVSLDAIGVTGWLKPKTRFVDLIGLSSPASAKIRAQNRDGWLTQIIKLEQPRVVIIKQQEFMTNVPASGSGRPFKLGWGFGEQMVGDDEVKARYACVQGYKAKRFSDYVVLDRSDTTTIVRMTP